MEDARVSATFVAAVSAAILAAIAAVSSSAALCRREGFSDEEEEEEEEGGDRYGCELVMENNLPRCNVTYLEPDSSIGSDVKCRILQEAHSGGAGSYKKTGSKILDEGRLRSSPGDYGACELLPTDTILYPDGARFPVCSKENSLLYDPRFRGTVDIEEDPEKGRCKIRFLNSSRAKLVSYSRFLDNNSAVQGMRQNRK